MAVRQWLRPPRHLLVLFVGITLVLAASLGWLGWRLLQQDRSLETQRVRERLEGAATAVAAALDQRLTETETTLRRLAALPAAEFRAETSRWARGLEPGAVLVVLGRDGLDAYPPNRLAFYPVVRSSPDASPATFAAGEALEFRSQDYAGAAARYRALVSLGDQRVRAGALLRLGRTLRKAGDLEAALSTYRQLEELDSLSVGGLPAGLIGRQARIAIFEALKRTPEARGEAESLRGDLMGGRWAIDRGAFEFYTEDLRRMGDTTFRETAQPAVTLARAVETVWGEWMSAPRLLTGTGRRLIRSGGPALVIRPAAIEREIALIVGTTHLEAVWLGGLRPLLDRQGVRVALDDPDGTPVVSQIPDDEPLQVMRAATETGLPGTLRVASADARVLTAEFGVRRRLMLAGLGVATLLVLFGTYAVARAVTRELEVARLQSDFVAAVSHEFRTPLTSLRQLAELLASGRVPTEERRTKYYQVIQREGERLHRLVEGLLDFGRMEAGALEFRLEPLDAATLVRDVVNEFRAEAAEHGYAVELAVNGEVGRVRADREALARAIWNLLDNAVKYSPDHRTVRVAVVGGGNGRLSISVQDRGAGIAPDEQGRIFEKFVRGDSARMAGVKGTGIGLAMVRHIVDGHGGDISVTSQPGAGSTFTITLPVEP